MQVVIKETKGDAKLTLVEHVTTDFGDEPLPADSDTEGVAMLKWTLSASEATVQILEDEMTILRRQLQDAKK